MANWLWWILVLLVSFIVFGFGPFLDASSTSSAMYVEINGNPGVILDSSAYSTDVEGWIPGEAHLQEAEDAVAGVEPVDGREPMRGGYRQYVGIVEDGERKVHINSMCVESERWDDTYIMVMDGGSCFWNATYNIDTGEVENLYVNGEA